MGASKFKIKRFTVSMPEDLLIELIEITNERKKQMINKICMEFIKMKQKENLISLKGKINFKKEENGE